MHDICLFLVFPRFEACSFLRDPLLLLFVCSLKGNQSDVLFFEGSALLVRLSLRETKGERDTVAFGGSQRHVAVGQSCFGTILG